MRRTYDVIRDLLWAAYWTAYAIIAIGPEQEGER